MKNQTFVQALAATARIACCAGLVGLISCAESDTNENDSSPKNPNDKSTDTDQQNTDTNTSQEIDPLEVDDDGDGLSENQGDCDDTNAAINPAANEICNQLDDDCDSLVDDAPIDGTPYFLDNDQDGYGVGEPELFCEQPSNYSDTLGDCDDNDASLTPEDKDFDGLSSCDGDCDDTNMNISPNSAEICDSIDNNCDGLIDNAECDLSLEECNTLVNETFSQSLPPTTTTSSCCQQIAESYDAVNLQGLENWTFRSECCNLLQWQGSLACTPWGPPTPPSMVKLS